MGKVPQGWVPDFLAPRELVSLVTLTKESSVFSVPSITSSYSEHLDLTSLGF